MTQILELNQLDEMLTGIVSQARGINYENELQTTADELAKIHAGYFDAEAGPDGTPWPAWHFRDPGASPTHPTLFVTGRLKQSLISGPDHIEDISENTLTFGTDVPYAAQNNYGGIFPVDRYLIGKGGEVKVPGSSITIPQREFVGINDAEVDKIAERIADATVAGLKVGS